jgi:hypothetical protein
MIGFDPISITLGVLPNIFGQYLQTIKQKKTAKQNIQSTLATDIDVLTKETKSIIAEAQLVTAAGGIKEQTLAPTLNTLLKKSTQELRNRAQRNIKNL